MSDETPAPEPDAATLTPAAATPPVKDWEAEAKKWEAMTRNAERTAAANARRVKEMEDRDLSEVQKLQRDREEAIADRDRMKAEAEQLRASDLRKQVAIEKGLPAALVGRLQGATAEELAADADSLLALVSTPRSPLPDLGQGPRPHKPTTGIDAGRAIYQEEKAKRRA